MKNLQGKDIKRGDQVIAKVADGNYVAATIAQLNERSVPDPTKPGKTLTVQSVSLVGYGVKLEPDSLVSAGDAWEAVGAPLAKVKADAAAAAKAAADAAQAEADKPKVPVVIPPPNASQNAPAASTASPNPSGSTQVPPVLPQTS